MSMFEARRDIPAGSRSTASRTPANGLRHQLIGTWQLVSYVDRDVDSGEETHPMGDHPLGFITYTPDGFVSAHLSSAHRPPFQVNDPYGGTAEEYTQAARRYVAYCGPFQVDERSQSLIHEMQVSLFPNWLGQRQMRLAQIDGDLLRLATAAPMTFAGTRKIAILVWRRVQPNC